jgi:hypothetical protein
VIDQPRGGVAQDAGRVTRPAPSPERSCRIAAGTPAEMSEGPTNMSENDSAHVPVTHGHCAYQRR